MNTALEILSALARLLWFAVFLYLVTRALFDNGRLRKLLRQPATTPEAGEPLSVVICAKNEASNLTRNLPTVLEQDYNDFEVVVVNDHSSDSTNKILQDFKKEYPHLSVYELQEHADYPGKKRALAYGVKKARHSRLVFTDADCEPASAHWLKWMGWALTQGDVVIGYGGYFPAEGWINKLVRWETYHTACQMFNAALAGRAYMAVGRNMAYHRQAFQEAGGVEAHADLPSGDDDLLLQSLKGAKTKVVVQQEAFTFSPAPQNFGGWWHQKQRHLSTAFRYSFVTKLRLALDGATRLLFYGLLPLVFIKYPALTTGLLLIRHFTLLFSLRPTARHFRAQGSLTIYMLWEMIWSGCTLGIHLKNMVAPPTQKWN